MAFLKRLGNIISANLNDILDGLENPEATMNQMIREIESGLIELRQATTAAVADRNLVEKKVSKAKEEKERWQKNAELAVAQGKDDLAVESLKRKNDEDARSGRLEEQLQSQQEGVTTLKEEYALAGKRLVEIREKRDALVAQKKVAEGRKTTTEILSRSHTLGNAGTDPVDRFSSSIAKFEDEVDRAQAEADAQREMRDDARGKDVETQLEELSAEATLQDELAALKQKMGKASD